MNRGRQRRGVGAKGGPKGAGDEGRRQVPDYSSYEVLEERLRVAVLYGAQGFAFA